MSTPDPKGAPDDIVNAEEENPAMYDQFKPTPDDPFDDDLNDNLAADDDLEFDADFAVEDEDDDDLVADGSDGDEQGESTSPTT